jgi:hypothetical protein
MRMAGERRGTDYLASYVDEYYVADASESQAGVTRRMGASLPVPDDDDAFAGIG